MTKGQFSFGLYDDKGQHTNSYPMKLMVPVISQQSTIAKLVHSTM